MTLHEISLKITKSVRIDYCAKYISFKSNHIFTVVPSQADITQAVIPKQNKTNL